jgi:tRNA(adenine34) deaminase
MRMLTFYINRAGKNLSTERKRTLERAKVLLHERVERSRNASMKKAA